MGDRVHDVRELDQLQTLQHNLQHNAMSGEQPTVQRHQPRLRHCHRGLAGRALAVLYRLMWMRRFRRFTPKSEQPGSQRRHQFVHLSRNWLLACGERPNVRVGKGSIKMPAAIAYGWAKRQTPAAPPPRYAASLVYDSTAGVAVLFGGIGVDARLNDTWTWDGSTWLERQQSVVPPPRSGASLVYDAGRQELVLFGGTDARGLPLGDTWTWDGTGWTERQPATSPPARSDASVAYDAGTQTVVLFGGATVQKRAGLPGLTFYNDLWLWNGTTWTQSQTSSAPSARSGASMVYDPPRRNVVLFGGESGSQRDDTWAWDGTAWAQRQPAATPPARAYASMAYDERLQAVVMFGGVDIAGLTDTWTWDGAMWTELQVVTPPTGGVGASLVYDAGRRSTVLLLASATTKKAVAPAGGYVQRPLVRTETWTA